MNPTQPSRTSTRALYLSNWQDMVGIWKAGELTQIDTSRFGPRLGELHYLRGSLARRTVNQIIEYTGFFRDETSSLKYTQVENFDAEAWFESSADNAGTLTTNYLTYHGAAVQPRLRISRSFAGPPNRPFFVVRYTLNNPTTASITFNILDQVHLRNLELSKDVHAWYDAANNALIADMTASGQLFVFLGALQTVDAYQVGNHGDTSTTSPTVAGWCSFDASGMLLKNGELRAPDIDLAFNKRLVVGPGQTQALDFYIGICETQVDVNAAITTARASSGSAWFSTTAAAYNAWLANGNQGRRVHFDDDGINLMFDRALIVIKNIQNPLLGTFSATTNPFAYGYKTWVRDAAVAAIALDASGHHSDAEKYWRWMAGRQGSDGTWKTTYNMWDGSYMPFVEPEYDSVGAFIYGAHRHYALTADTQFLDDLWPTVKKAADWILTNIEPNGFGQADYSIWEEAERGLEHNSYTQAWYVAGLYSTQCLAEVLGDTSLAEWYAGGAGSILTALQRPSNWNPPGSWNPTGYYNRAVNANNTPQPLVDSSSDMLIALQVIDHESARAETHIAKILATLTKQKYGLARYLGDTFYYTDRFSPGGNEALAADPSWPQMSLWVAVYEVLSGQSATALSRLEWCVSILGAGYMPPGEAVSNVTLQPLLSSMCEPLTAAAFILAALAYEGQYTLSVVPPVYNAGAAHSIRVNFATAGDWAQWISVPYYVGPQSPSDSPPMYRIKRVYMTNDSANIYLRVDNEAGKFSPYQQQPFFGLRVYSQDFCAGNVPTTHFGLSGEPLRRPMSYVIERHSDSDTYRRWTVSHGIWVIDRTVDWVISPQWDSASGRMEAIVPISVLASGTPILGNAWADVLIVLASCEDTAMTWHDEDSMLLHDRLSTQDQNWIYGNIEK
jgi:GH15 family glucan-1,4-alpha-glucosidase